MVHDLPLLQINLGITEPMGKGKGTFKLGPLRRNPAGCLADHALIKNEKFTHIPPLGQFPALVDLIPVIEHDQIGVGDQRLLVFMLDVDTRARKNQHVRFGPAVFME
jgi:hypothetical protein